MNETKMNKNFFFQMIEERIEHLKKRIEEMKTLTPEERIITENMLFGRIMELHAINVRAMHIDYWKYSELDDKINELEKELSK